MDFNLWEITLLVMLAIIVFGPEKLPELARKAARVLHYLRRIGNDARGQLRKELGPEFDNLSLADLNPKTFVAKHLLSGEEMDDFRAIGEELKGGGNLVREAVADTSGALTDAAAAVRQTPAASPVDAGAASAAGPVGSAASAPARSVPFDPEAT